MPRCSRRGSPRTRHPRDTSPPAGCSGKARQPRSDERSLSWGCARQPRPCRSSPPAERRRGARSAVFAIPTPGVGIRSRGPIGGPDRSLARPASDRLNEPCGGRLARVPLILPVDETGVYPRRSSVRLLLSAQVLEMIIEGLLRERDRSRAFGGPIPLLKQERSCQRSVWYRIDEQSIARSGFGAGRIAGDALGLELA